jgi:aminoglycoside phosphotransferase (APT) family kinase protein
MDTVMEAAIIEATPAHSHGHRWQRLAGEANDVWATGDETFVIRIAPTDTFSLVRPEATVHAARLLEHAGVPAIRLVEDHPQPFDVSGRTATMWHFSRNERPATPKDVAHTLAALHATSATASQLPGRDLRPVVQGRLEQLRRTQPERADYWLLLDRCRRAVEGCIDDAEPAVVHGDMRSSNVLISGGLAVLADLDSVSFAPRLFDTWRFGVDRVAGRLSTSEYAEFCDIAGSAPEKDQMSAFVRLLQLAFTTLAELRLTFDPQPRWVAQQKRFERWWRQGADVAELPGWEETWA